MNRFIAATAALAATVALAGCTSEPTAITTTPAAATSSSAAAAAPVDTPSEEPSDQVASFGQTFTYQDGLEISVSDKGKFTPSAYASGGEGQNLHEKFRVTVTNGTDAVYDPSLLSVAVNSGGEDGDQVFDTGLDGSPTGKVRPGKSISYDVGFGIADRGDITLTVSDFRHDDATFAND